MQKETIFQKLWDIYTHQNPSVLEVYEHFREAGEEVVNDHIAFRTFDDPRVNIDVLAKPFLNAGYQEKGSYVFEAKKLFARHFEHESDTLAPRVFISQLKLDEVSPFIKETATRLVDQIPAELLQSNEMIFSGCVWGSPSWDVYEKLREESEYAAWLYVNGFQANHFTVSVNHLSTLNSLEKVNAFLKEKGFQLNDAGGEIKGNPAELLEQSSIRAGLIPIAFVEGIREIPGCYYEFARRYPDKDGKLYSGFIAKSADKIFESTDFSQKKA